MEPQYHLMLFTREKVSQSSVLLVEGRDSIETNYSSGGGYDIDDRSVVLVVGTRRVCLVCIAEIAVRCRTESRSGHAAPVQRLQ